MDEVRGISIDIGKNLGWTAWVDGFPHAAGLLDLSSDYPGAEYQRFREFLWALPLRQYQWAAYEDVRPVNKHHMYRHFGVLAFLAHACWDYNIPLIPLVTGEWKKAMGVKGNAKKSEVMARAEELYPHLDYTTDDVSDSLGIGLGALTKIRVATP